MVRICSKSSAARLGSSLALSHGMGFGSPATRVGEIKPSHDSCHDTVARRDHDQLKGEAPLERPHSFTRNTHARTYRANAGRSSCMTTSAICSK